MWILINKTGMFCVCVCVWERERESAWVSGYTLERGYNQQGIALWSAPVWCNIDAVMTSVKGDSTHDYVSMLYGHDILRIMIKYIYTVVEKFIMPKIR